MEPEASGATQEALGTSRLAHVLFQSPGSTSIPDPSA